MKSHGALRTVADRTGLTRLAKLRRTAADFAEAAEENAALDAGLEVRVAHLERVVGELAQQRARQWTERAGS